MGALLKAIQMQFIIIQGRDYAGLPSVNGGVQDLRRKGWDAHMLILIALPILAEGAGFSIGA